MAATCRAVSCGASFAVVDEGPGLSGSSFLAVAEALERAGAAREKIFLVSSHAPNLNALCADNAARRWQRFHCIPVAGEARRPAEAVDFIGGGQWRSRVFANEPEWPAAWTSFERLKYLSSSGARRAEDFQVCRSWPLWRCSPGARTESRCSRIRADAARRERWIYFLSVD